MPAYTIIPNGDIDQDSPITQPLMTALRDNPIAMFETDPTAPVNPANWHPYNKVTNGDANDGTIWSFAVNGAVASVTTPDFVDGWEYAFLIEQLFSSGGTAQSLLANLYRETSAAYAGAAVLSAANNVSNVLSISPWLELLHARKTRKKHVVAAYGTNSDSGDAVGADNAPYLMRTNHTTPQKILRAQFSVSGGNITGNAASRIQMLRRSYVL